MKFKTVSLIQMVLLVAFVIIYSAEPFGTAILFGGGAIDASIVEGNFPDTLNLTPPQSVALFVGGLAVVETILCFFHRSWQYVVKYSLCAVRMVLPAFYVYLDVNNDAVKLTPYPYLLCVLACGALILHIWTRVQTNKVRRATIIESQAIG